METAQEIIKQQKEAVGKAIDLFLNFFDGDETHLEVRRYGYGKYEYAPKLHISLICEKRITKRQMEQVYSIFPNTEFYAFSKGAGYGSAVTRIFLNPSK